jgi:prophage tail gpP-like protein
MSGSDLSPAEIQLRAMAPYFNAILGKDTPPAATQPKPDPNQVTITLGQQSLSGWLGVRITRGIERFPSDFELIMSELYPSSLSEISIIPGTPCAVYLGSQVVLTGYVDAYEAELSETEHTVRVQGRSTCEDLVDCSALFQTVQLSNQTLGQLATQLVQPFGVTVSLPDGDSATVPQFTIIVTETCYEVIERAARWNAKLVYDGTDGNLVIASVGAVTMASGFTEGVNVQRAQGLFSYAERMTKIAAISQTTGVLTNDTTNPPIVYVAVPLATDPTFPARADGTARYRPLLILAEQDMLAQDQGGLMAYRVQWEMARRIGRSQAITITCDNWRDSAGDLWAINQLAPISLPSCKVQETWIISEVTFLRDADGTRAEVTLMPSEAFEVEPIVLQPFQWQLDQNDPNPNAQS